nr:hypothetical protein [Tanacetum cinerariifolium]
MSFKEIQKLYTREQKWVDAFVPIGSKEDEKRVGSREKRVAGLSSKQKSPKKQKVNDQETKDSDKELVKCLKVVPDDDKAIDYETLDIKSPIFDCESQLLRTNKVGDVHVYKLTRLNGSYRHFSTFSRMLKVLDRQDVLDLQKIIMKRFPANDPEGYDLILWGDQKTLMESKKRYPLTNEILEKMLSWRLDDETKNPSPSCRPTKVEVPKELPKVSMVNTSLKKVKHHLAGFNVVVKERTMTTAITEEQGLIIVALKDDLRKLKGKALVDNAITTHIISPEMLKIDMEPIAPRLLNNRTTHSNYLKLTQEQAAILREVVEQGKS